MGDKKVPELTYLRNNEVSYLDWNWKDILGDTSSSSISAVRKGIYTDGNCFFHSVLNSTSRKYRDMDKKEQLTLCNRLRISFADTLSYETFLSLKVQNGFVLTDDSYSAYIKGDKKDPKSRYEGYKRYISTSGVHVSTEVIHLVAKELEIDIYLMRQNNQGNGELVIQPVPTEEAFLKRPSIILLYVHNHYEIVGIVRNCEKDSCDAEIADFFFKPDNPIIKKLYRKQIDGWKAMKAAYADK